MPSSIDTKHDLSAYETGGNPEPFSPTLLTSARPPIDYSSVSAFSSSVKNRFVSIWTRSFILSLLAGQVVSLCITCTNVTTTELVNRNWALPTTQTFFLCVPVAGSSCSSDQFFFRRYLSLFCVYTPYTIYQCKCLI